MLTQQLNAHGVLVGYQLGSFPGGNNVRVWIEHWHGAATNVSSFPLQWRINTSSGSGTTQTTYATGYVNGQNMVTLQGNQGTVNWLPGACSNANNYGNWVYWDFNISVCSTNPTQLEIIAGSSVTTAEGCSSLYPQTIGGVNAPLITVANDITYTSCPPVTVDPSTLTNYSVSSLCDANPTTTLTYGSSSWQVGTTPVPTWTVNSNSTVTVTATDNNTLQTSTNTFNFVFLDNTAPTVVAQNITVTIDPTTSQAVITPAQIDNGSSDNCGGVTLSLSKTTFTCLDVGTNTVILYVTDGAGNVNTGTATVTVATTALSFTPPSDITVSTDASSCVASSVNLGTPVVTGQCYSVTNDAPTQYPIGSTTVTWTVTEADGTISNYTQNVTVNDANLPWVNLQSSITVSSNTAAVELDANATSGATQNINGATVVIGTNFQSGDKLDISGTVPTGVSKSYNSTSGVLTISGTMTPAQFQTILQNITFGTTSTVSNSVRSITITAGQSISLNGHYYEYVPGSYTWAQAKTAASNRTLNGLQGYLATITSQTENDFIRSKLSADAWIGGSDDFNHIYNVGSTTKKYSSQSAAEGRWHWVTGPESGQQFSNGNGSPVTSSGMYANWNSGEPNNMGSEHYLQFYSSGSSNGRWNDLPASSSLAYVVEYGGLASDPSCLSFSDDIIVVVNTVPIVTTNTSATTVASTSATLGGTVVNQGGSAVIDRGIAFSTSPNPTISNGKASSGTGTGAFTANLSGLQANTLYYAKAFATNGQGTAYGAEITFTTTPNIPNGITTTADVASLGGAFLCPGSSVTLSSSVDVGTIEWFSGSCGSTVIGTGNSLTLTPSGTTTYFARASNSTTGLVSECTSVLVTVQDTFSPVLVLNTGVVVNLDASGATTLSISDVDNGSYDDCGLTHVSFASGSLTSSLSYNCSDVGSQTVNVYALDDNGNESVTSFTFTVVDIIAPTFTTTSPTLYLDVNGNVTLTTSDIITSVVENCSVASTVLSKTSFDCGDVGSNTVSITITDVNGNFTTATETVTIVDATAPDIHVTDVQVALGSDGTVVVTPSSVDDGTTDACGSLVWTLSDSTFDCSDIGAHLETATVTDAHGNSSSASIIITVADNSAPLVVTKSATIYLDAYGQATLDSTDVIDYIQENCSLGSITLSQVSFNASTLGSNTVTVTVTDASGNAASGLAIVTVVDNIAPTAATKNIILPLDAQGQGYISTSDINNGSSDNVGISTYAADVTMFDCNDLGDNWVVLTVTDASGSFDTAWSKVTVVDNAAPSVVAQNYSVALDASGTATVLASQVDAGTSDNCGVASLALSQTSFSCSDLGQNTLTFTAIDGSGNSSTASVVVTVTDDLAPTVVTKSATLYLNAMGMVTLDTADVISSAVDNCAISVMSLSNTSFGCTDVGTNQVTLNVTDGSNNTASSVVSVTVLDTITPTITMADTVTVYANATCGASATWAVLADDNCSYALSSNYASGSTFNIGYHNVITTVTDPSGNAASATTVIEVLDTLAPVWTSSSFVYSMVPNTASCGSFVTWISPVAFDLCSSVSVTASATNGSSFGLGTQTVTFTATDAAGNSNTQSITFTVVDDIAPELIVPSDIVVNNDAGQCGASVSYAAAFALDNCNLDTVYYSHAPGTYFPVGQNQVNVTALDAAGNASSGMFTITVVDNESPTLLSAPNDTVLGYCNASFVYPTPSFDDNCGVFSVTLISGIASGNVFPVGTTENIYVATDVHGNTDTVAFNVTVINQYPATIPFYGLVCSNSPNYDLTMGDSSLVFTGNYVTNNLFSPSTSGPGEHNLVYAFTDSLGCVSYGTLTLTVEEAPTMPVVQRLGANYLTTQHYDQYQWYLNGNPIPGTTSQNLVASVAGNYKVKVWNTAGCSRISSIMAVGTIGLDEASVDDLKVYPNPSQGQFNIDMVGVSGTITLKIYDSMGRFISEQTLESGYVQMIDISNASSGMYQLVLMDSEGHVVVRRVTIQK